jgi:hypothetical protein
MSKNYAGLTDYQMAAFETLVYNPGTTHTGKVMDELRKKGLVYLDPKGGYRIWSHIEEEWRQWDATHPSDLDVDANGKPYGSGVKVK